MHLSDRTHDILKGLPGLDDSFDAARRRLASLVGAVLLGLIAILFAKMGDQAQEMFSAIFRHYPYAPLAMTPIAFVAVVWLTVRFFPAAKGSGIPQVMAASKDPELAYSGLLSLPVALGKLVLTVIMLMVGGSVGREGPTVQVSAAIMIACHRVLRVPITAGVLIAGGAAGVAAAFNTPLGGIVFAIEELASAYEQRVAVLVMGAVVVSGLVSLGIAGDYLYFGAVHESLPIVSVILVSPVAGIAGGVLGGAFAKTLLLFSRSKHAWFTKARSHPIVMAFVCGLIVAVIGVLTKGNTWGTGYATTRDMIEGTAATSAWFGPAKFVATAATAVSGAPGGIFAPSLAVGAGFGQLLSFCFPGTSVPAVILLGMCGYFVGVTRAPLTAVILLMETTGARAMILPLFVTAMIADSMSRFVSREKLYHGLSHGFLMHGERETSRQA
ncbi:chloride channel protein [Novosphingobium sp. 9]|uniref:chloride channel protein n=1 Tax=Novosphingobium sp. 9 TaxID=2025349 RepID=UPI0021B5708C|nr:chloride channel protein [Novosphingobium sp. 9]